MAEPTERFVWGGVACQTQAVMIDGHPHLAVDIAPDHEGIGTVSVVWAPGFTSFGVFIDDQLIYPLPDTDTDDIIVIPANEGTTE